MSVSLCMIVKDEEDNLKRCLESVQGIVDEIILVDTGSTDRTLEIAREFGAVIFHFPWNDSFADARNVSLSHASGDWTLVMDADDELVPEDRGKLAALLRDSPPGAEVYCGKTLCFSGAAPDCCSVLVTSNIRLIRNGLGYRFVGRIHEQLCAAAGRKVPSDGIRSAEIRFLHYGYLNQQVERKEKHRRNIALIQKELEENPENPFMLFNMGNELLALFDAKRALKYYARSYRFFDPAQGYSSTLLSRMIVCCDQLHRYREAFEIIREGRKHFPALADFEFLKAGLYQEQNRLPEAVRSYRRCIHMGNTDPDAVGIAGMGSFQPHLALAQLYAQMGDVRRALIHCRKAVQANSSCRTALALEMNLLLRQGLRPACVKNRLLKDAKPDAEEYLVLSDLFYDRGLFRQAMQLARAALSQEPENEAVQYDEGVCRFYLGLYRSAGRCLKQVNCGAFRNRAALFRLLASVFGRGAPSTGSLTEKLDPEYRAVSVRFLPLLNGERCAPFDEDDSGSSRYLEPTFQLLEILLRAGRSDDFRKALPLLNLMDDDSVLLRLGKLYYRYGYAKPAWRELMRSIRLTGRIDAEGLEILRNTISAADY